MSYNDQPAGWYRAQGDPPNTIRYWDGAAWVGEPAPVPGAVANSPSVPPPPGQGQGPQAHSFAPAAAYPEKSQAVAALVLSILGLLMCGLLAVPGWIMGQNEISAIDRGHRSPDNRGTAVAAKVIGIITVALYVLAILFVVFVGVAASR